MTAITAMRLLPSKNGWFAMIDRNIAAAHFGSVSYQDCRGRLRADSSPPRLMSALEKTTGASNVFGRSSRVALDDLLELLGGEAGGL